MESLSAIVLFLFFGAHLRVFVFVTGDITIKLPETSVELDLQANKVIIDDKLNVADQKREVTGDKEKFQGK